MNDDKRIATPLTPAQAQMLKDSIQQTERDASLQSPALPANTPQNFGALYHHVSWALKLLGNPLETLPDGAYTLAFQMEVTKGEVQLTNYSLEGEV